jgi:hypothetical protein
MTNDEIRKTRLIWKMTLLPALKAHFPARHSTFPSGFGIRTSSFFRHSPLGIRHLLASNLWKVEGDK